MRGMPGKGSCLCTALVTWCLLAHATDAESIDPIAPAVVDLPAHVTIDRADLRIEGAELTTAYTLSNASTAAETTGFTLYSPVFEWPGHDTAYPDRSPQSVEVTFLGKRLDVSRHVHAFHDGRAITASLRQEGIDPARPATGESAAWVSSSANRRKLAPLLRKGIVSAQEGALLPNWHMLTIDQWRVGLPAKTDGVLQLRYVTHPAYEAVSWDSRRLDRLLREHCSSLEEAQHLLWAGDPPGPGESVVVMRYMLDRQGRLASSADHVSIGARFDKQWTGLTAVLSLICSDGERPAYGLPDLPPTELQGADALSLLVLWRP